LTREWGDDLLRADPSLFSLSPDESGLITLYLLAPPELGRNWKAVQEIQNKCKELANHPVTVLTLLIHHKLNLQKSMAAIPSVLSIWNDLKAVNVNAELSQAVDFFIYGQGTTVKQAVESEKKAERVVAFLKDETSVREAIGKLNKGVYPSVKKMCVVKSHRLASSGRQQPYFLLRHNDKTGVWESVDSEFGELTLDPVAATPKS